MCAVERNAVLSTDVIGQRALGWVLAMMAEGVLPPMWPSILAQLQLASSATGIVFAVSGSAGGLGVLVAARALRKADAVHGFAVGGVLAGLGCLGMASAAASWSVFVSAAAIGAGLGVHYTALVVVVARRGSVTHRGQVFGGIGLLAALGLAMAAGVAMDAARSWRLVFLGVGALLLVSTGPLLRRAPVRPAPIQPVGLLLGPAVWVGAAAGAGQYAIVVCLPMFTADRWSLTVAEAANLLLFGRLAAVPLKALAAASADVIGSRWATQAVAALLVISVLGWALLPATLVGHAALILYVGGVSALFPLANLLAANTPSRDPWVVGQSRMAQLLAGASVSAVLAMWPDALPLLAVTPLALFMIRIPQTSQYASK